MSIAIACSSVASGKRYGRAKGVIRIYVSSSFVLHQLKGCVKWSSNSSNLHERGLYSGTLIRSCMDILKRSATAVALTNWMISPMDSEALRGDISVVAELD